MKGSYSSFSKYAMHRKALFWTESTQEYVHLYMLWGEIPYANIEEFAQRKSLAFFATSNRIYLALIAELCLSALCSEMI